MKCLQYIFALACMAAWLWLALHGHTDAEFWVYNDEFGHLLSILPIAACTLALIALKGREKGANLLAGLWTPATLCMMLPVLLAMNVPLLSPQALRYGICMATGMGFGVCFLVVGSGIATLSMRNIVLVVGGGMLVTNVLLAGMVLLSQHSLMLMYFLLSAALKLLITSPSTALPVSRSTLSTRAMLLCCSIWGLTGFCRSIYYSLFIVNFTWLPDSFTDTLLIPGAACLLALLCIQLSSRSARGKSLFLLVPVLLVGYTAWPMLHRESLGLSMLTLNFAYTVLDVFSYLALFYTASRLGGEHRHTMLAWGGCALVGGLWLGSFTPPLIRVILSQGVAVNYMFLFLAVMLLGTSLAFTLLLEHMGFWGATRLPKMGTSPANEAIPVGTENLSTEVCDTLLRQMDLTRQQALIATLIAQKRTDAEICASLNISQSTLKTHVRNILKRLGLSSRYEIAWLIVHAMREAGFSEQEAPK